MSKHKVLKRSKTCRANIKKRKIDDPVNNFGINQTSKTSYENHEINVSASGIIKIEPTEFIQNEESKLILVAAETANLPFYTVDLGDSASTEALLHVEKLKVEPDLFSQESNESSTVKDSLEEVVKQHKFLNEMEKFTKSVQIPPTTLVVQKSNSTKSNITSNEKQNDSTREPIENQNYNQIHRLNYHIADDCFDLQPDIGNQILSLVKKTNAITHKNNVKLDTLTKEVDTIKKNQTAIINFLLNKQLVDIEPTDFKKMYNIEIPCKDLGGFKYFDEQLAHNDLLKSDVVSQLTNCIDKRDCSLTKSFANMLRLFMTATTLSNFTAIRKSAKSDKDRQIFASTNLYKLMSGIVTKERRDKNLGHDTKDLHSALSDVISHSGKWPT